MIKITKRSNDLQEFNVNKIKNAIRKAFIEVNENVDEEIISQLAEEVKVWDKISVEEIQDQIEELLMSYDFYSVAKAYILYRNKREVIRNQESKLIKGIADKLEANNVENQNANVDEYSFGGRMGEANRIVLKDYALNYCMSDMAKKNHLNNEIYIHDLDSYAVGMHNCLSIPFDDLLANGFKTRQTDVRPANSINTAFQLVAVLFQIQSLQQFGGVSATHLDWTMVPYVRKSFYKHIKDYYEFVKGVYYLGNLNSKSSLNDWREEYINWKDSSNPYDYALSMTEKELKQAVEGMYHNLNTLQSRSGKV